MLQRNSLLDKALAGLRRPGKVMQRLDLARDYLSFRRKYSFLSRTPESVDPSKKVLVVSLNDSVAQVKMEGVLAKALQSNGYSPVIVSQWNSWGARYFRTFGFNDHVFFSQVIEETPAEVMEEANAILEGPLSFAALHGLEYRGAYVGRHVLSTIVRNLRNGSISFDDPQVLTSVRELLPYAFQCAWAAAKVMDDVQPEIALFMEKGYVGYGELFDVAVNKGVHAIQIPHSHRKDALMLKRYSKENRLDHPFSLSSDSWRAAKAMPWENGQATAIVDEIQERYQQGTWFDRKFAQNGKVLKSPGEVRAQLGLDPQKKTAVIYSHVLWDATFFYGDNLFDDYEHWLLETVKAACSNTNMNWVVKIHPDYTWKLKQVGDANQPRDIMALAAEIGRLPDHVKLLEPETDISTYSVFQITDYGITVRGTVGIELSCLGVPVITAGTGRYSGMGFTIDSQTREEYLETLAKLHELPPPTELETEMARRYAYAVLKLRPMPFETFSLVQRPFHKLGHVLDDNGIINARSFEEFTSAKDLKVFADWAAGSDKSDFLLDSPVLDGA